VAALIGSIAVLILPGLALSASPHLTLDPLRGPAGTTVQAGGTGFCSSCGPVEIDFLTTPAKRGITVASDGSFQATFLVPGGAQAGTDAVNAYQQGSLVTQTSFTVTPSTSAPTGAPPTLAPTPQNAGSGRAGSGSAAPGHPSSTPAANGSGPGSGASGGTGGAKLAAGGPGSGPPTAAIALGALGAVIAIGLAAVLLYRRLRLTA
jgi:hypothetical protein